MIASLAIAGCMETTVPSVRPSLDSAPIVSDSPSLTPAVSTSLQSPLSSIVAPATPPASPQPSESVEPAETPIPSATQIPGCGTGEGAFAVWRPTIPRTLAFGHATIEFTTATVAMRDGSVVTDDAIPGGIGLSPNEIAVVVAPGDHIVLRGQALVFVETSVSAADWVDVEFSKGLAELGGSRIGLDWRVRGDGSLSISAPDHDGDWAVEFVPRWQTQCLAGDGTAYARIKVR
jgi:hypothetical protein